MEIIRKAPIGVLDHWVSILSLVAAVGFFLAIVTGNFPITLLSAAIYLGPIALAFKPVPPVAVALVLRFGRRVVVREVDYYYRLVNRERVGITEKEWNDLAFDRHAPDIFCDTSTEYLEKGEGWRLPFPFLERLVLISQRKYTVEVNERLSDETEEQFQQQAESFVISTGVHIIPEIVYSWWVINAGMAFRIGRTGFDDTGYSQELAKMVRNLILAATRQILGKLPLEAILTREVEDENGNRVPLAEKIRHDLVNTPEWRDLGIDLDILRIEDIKFQQDAKDVLDALEAIQKQEFEYQRQLKLAEQNYRITVRNAEAQAEQTRKLADANRHRREQEAAAEREFLRQQIAAFAGKSPEEITREDAESYAAYQTAFRTAQSLDENSTIILTDSELGKLVGNIGGLVKGVREGMGRRGRPGQDGGGTT